MNPALSQRKTTVPRRQERGQLGLTLEQTQSSKSMPSTSRTKCLRLWRELLLSVNLARYDGARYGLRVPGRDVIDMYERTRAAGFGKEVRRRIMIGTYVFFVGDHADADRHPSAGAEVCMLIKRDFEKCFAEGIYAILTPTTPSAAFAIGEKGRADPIEMYLNDVFTVTVNMAGLPGISVPSGLDAQGLPLGLQLIGRPFEEETPASRVRRGYRAGGRKLNS